ncbi:O-antigen polymerase [Bergeyella sp. RCAD1439]|uniref:O-antigen polymerase n=1 Tax=Bergeyella anatis TaxID=3113737 RepID=UPI002E192001|nr:O-antigen polymerase [Bergeyella sp. RCAD1439]
MEVIALSIVFLLLSILGYALDRKILNPLFITPFLWGGLLFLYWAIPHPLYALQEQFLYAILIWVFSFFMGGLLFVNKKKFGSGDLYNKKVFNMYYYVVLVFAPMALITLVMEAIKVGPEMFFLRLRLINTGLDEDDSFSLGALGYVFNFTNVVCLLFTFYYEKLSKFKYYVVLFLAFLLGIITLARTSLVALIIGIFVILYFKKVLKKKHYFYFVGAFAAIMLMITMFRSFHEESSIEIADTLAIYLLAGMPAFDTLVYYPTEDVGNYTFRFFYAVANALGADYGVEKTILSYAYVPMPTNVYTVMYPFFKDFGNIGVGIFGFTYGVIFVGIYKLKINPIGVILYALILPSLMLQFFGEYIYQNFSTYLQYMIFLLAPYFLKTGR